MNTVGKILVILNFLFAIIVGALLIMNAAIGNQWKDAYLALKNDATVLKAGRDTDANATRAVTGDYQRNRLELDALKQKLTDAETTAALKEGEYKTQIATLNLKIDDQRTTLAETAKSHARAVDEINELYKTIKDREKLIAKHEADNKVLRARAQHSEQQLATMTARNENLLEQNRLLTLAQAKEKAGINSGRVAIKTNEPNPPAVDVKGKVEKVEGDLVRISLGTDHSVNKDNTLDIYRLKPAPQYLGMIRIVEANNHTSVGRLVQSGNAAFRPALREGDVVSSKLP